MKSPRILNIGCGNSFYGTDRIDLYESPSTTKVCNIEEKLPFKDNSFDEIYCKSVLEHIKNLGLFVEECFRVLKYGGKIWIRTDFAGYLPTHLFKSHEHNRLLDVQYSVKGQAYGHEQNEDAHYHLFVESHLRKLFKKFKNHKISN